MRTRQLPITTEELMRMLSEHEIYNTDAYLDSETGQFLTLASDLIEYCQGHREGTDLQLSDSHDLPAAQAVADELNALETGFDEDGLPYNPQDRRYFPIPRLGTNDVGALRAAAEQWLQQWQLGTKDWPSY